VGKTGLTYAPTWEEHENCRSWKNRGVKIRCHDSENAMLLEMSIAQYAYTRKKKIYERERENNMKCCRRPAGVKRKVTVETGNRLVDAKVA
jgi:hypothetical protein